MSVECQVNVKSQSELDIGGRETCRTWEEANMVVTNKARRSSKFASNP